MKRLTERKENGAINVRYATEHETAISTSRRHRGHPGRQVRPGSPLRTGPGGPRREEQTNEERRDSGGGKRVCLR